MPDDVPRRGLRDGADLSRHRRRSRRFRKSKSIGAVFWTTGSKYQSGEIDRSGRTSCCGDDAGHTQDGGEFVCQLDLPFDRQDRPQVPCWKGIGADSEEKHELAGDVDIAVVDSLKALDLNRD